MRAVSPHARSLRQNTTAAERAIWHAVRDRRLGGLEIRRQVSIGPFVVDFACVDARLAAEIDGGQHGPESGGRRTACIRSTGYEVVRFWNNDALQNLDGVLETLLDQLRVRTLTQPSSRGRGL